MSKFKSLPNNFGALEGKIYTMKASSMWTWLWVAQRLNILVIFELRAAHKKRSRKGGTLLDEKQLGGSVYQAAVAYFAEQSYRPLWYGRQVGNVDWFKLQLFCIRPLTRRPTFSSHYHATSTTSELQVFSSLSLERGVPNWVAEREEKRRRGRGQQFWNKKQFFEIFKIFRNFLGVTNGEILGTAQWNCCTFLEFFRNFFKFLDFLEFLWNFLESLWNFLLECCIRRICSVCCISDFRKKTLCRKIIFRFAHSIPLALHPIWTVVNLSYISINITVYRLCSYITESSFKISLMFFVTASFLSSKIPYNRIHQCTR